jgi:Zn-dependent peptidase ImmA (M78 family)/transcriptional regulator with XRE-family HTH domain
MTTATFQPARLRVARELAGLGQKQLAEQIGLTPAAVSQFEGGAARPSPDSLDALSTALLVPVEFFGEPITETHEGFFRSLRRTSAVDRRRARAVAHVAHDVAVLAATTDEFPVGDIPVLPPSGLKADFEEIEVIAARVRARWNVPFGPVTNVVTLMEQHGVAVIRLPLGGTDVDAFSLPFPDHPVVVLGADKNDRARSRFDGAHELGHLVLHGEQMWGMKEVETQAHQFAAGFLMPADEIHDQLPTSIDWPRFFALKQHWQVSLAALLMRAKTLKRINDSTYLTAIKAASARGWRRVEPVPLGPPEQPEALMEFLAMPSKQAVRAYLPTQVVQDIAAATVTR